MQDKALSCVNRISEELNGLCRHGELLVGSQHAWYRYTNPLFIIVHFSTSRFLCSTCIVMVELGLLSNSLICCGASVASHSVSGCCGHSGGVRPALPYTILCALVHTRDRTSRDGSRGGMGWLVSKSRQQLSNGRGGSDEGVWDSSSPSTGPSCSSEEAEMPRFLPVTAIVQVPACSGITFGSLLVNYWVCCRFHLNSGFAVVMAWVIALLIYVCYCNAS